jgi:hypothetical protein
MKSIVRNLSTGIQVNMIDRDLALVLATALGIAIAFGTTVVMVASKF